MYKLLYMDDNYFKQKLRENVKEYLNIDNEIATLQAAIKERKTKKEELSKFILGAMKNNEKALDVINHILTNRTKVERVKLKRLTEKKKKKNVNLGD